jgi:hypothetical protein
MAGNPTHCSGVKAGARLSLSRALDPSPIGRQFLGTGVPPIPASLACRGRQIFASKSVAPSPEPWCVRAIERALTSAAAEKRAGAPNGEGREATRAAHFLHCWQCTRPRHTTHRDRALPREASAVPFHPGNPEGGRGPPSCRCNNWDHPCHQPLRQCTNAPFGSGNVWRKCTLNCGQVWN